jgi:hypothetical protein
MIPKLVKQVDKGFSVVGKRVPQIATQLTGYASGFRQVADRFGISPFDPQPAIDRLGKLEGDIKRWQKEVGAIGEKAIGYYSQVQSVAKKVGVKIDWLN